MVGRTLRVTGSLAGDFVTPTSEGSLVGVLNAARDGSLAMRDVVDVLRETEVLVGLAGAVEAPELSFVDFKGSAWVSVFSSPQAMASFFRSAGRGEEKLRFGGLRGSELLDEVWPQLPRGTGLVLDPGSPHVLALPPIAGLAPDSAALEEVTVPQVPGGGFDG